MAGSQLSLMINNSELTKFTGYDSELNAAYNMSLKSNHDWMQYVIHIDRGTLDINGGQVKCDGKQILIQDLELQVDFTWTPPNSGDEIATLTIGYAPFYTLISVQSFEIPPSKRSNDQTDTDKTEI